MNGKKKLNLLPEEVKNKYFKKYVIYAFGIVGALCAVVLMVQYINIGILNWQIKSITQENNKYNAVKKEIAELDKSIAEYEEFIKLYDNECFPFAQFMYDLETYRPESVAIISVDTPDRLIGIEETEEKKDEKTENPDAEKKPDDESKEDKEQPDKKESTEKELKPSETETGKTGYKSDMANQQIIIRGFGKNQEDISNYIYRVSKLSYIKSAKITAIEEHRIEDGVYNIFEVVVVGGDM